MIESSIEGTLPSLNGFTLEQFFEKGSQIMLRSVQSNFMAGGRPDKWKALKAGGASHLFKSGTLLDSIHATVGEDFAEVSTDLVYAAPHQFGAVIKHPGSDKFQAFQVGGAWIYTHKTKLHDIPIPARPFMVFQETDVVEIIDLAGRNVIEFMNANGQPLRTGESAA